MSVERLLRVVADALDAAGIPYMVAGSFASSRHGEPRATQDIDLVIDPEPRQLDEFVARLDSEQLYIGDARAALAGRDQFNLVEPSTGLKVDVIIRKDRPFSRAEFDRRVPASILGVDTFVATAEDTILAKLEWGRRGGSERQQRDVVGVLRVKGSALDHAYLDGWARELEVIDELQSARVAAGLTP